MRLILKLIAAPFIVFLTVLFCRGQALDAVCRCMGGGYLVIKVRGKLTRCVWNNKLEIVTLKKAEFHHHSFLLFPIAVL